MKNTASYDETEAQRKRQKANKCQGMTRLNAELRRQAEAEGKKTEKIVDPDEERKGSGSSQRPSEVTITEEEVTMQRARDQKNRNGI
jgi:hypothetical protein